jgi:HSP20 family protein
MDAKDKTALEKREASSAAEFTRSGPHYVPAVDILESDDQLLVLADMPGVAREDVSVNIENGILTVTGYMRPRRLDEGFRLVAGEHERGHFSRSFALAEEIDSGKIEATLTNGVLRLRLPKVAAARARRISVQGE